MKPGVRLGMEGHQITAKGTFGETMSFRAVPAKRSPVSSASASLILFEKHAGDGSTGWEMNLQWSYRYDAWRESVGWLRAGYLYLFALLGHNYILREELNCVREQFASPGQKQRSPTR